MIEYVIMILIYLCLLAVAFYLIIWVLEQLGITIPPQVMKILWVIVVFLAILMIVKVLTGAGIRLGMMTPVLNWIGYA